MNEPANKAVFLSYASQDAEAAKRICDALRAAGIEVWFDQSELVGGDAWDQKIRKQIKECALFLPVVSANTEARLEGYFRLEWKLAEDRSHLMAKGKAFIVPLAIDGINERDAHVPDSFLAVQWMRNENGAGPTAWVKQVQSLLGCDGFTSSSPVLPNSARAALGTRMPAKSIAVLAFANLSRDPENECFSDGLSEELLNVLAKISGLRVTARTSSFYFKGRNVPVPEIAQKLGVSYVVEGSVRKAGSRVRITAQLISATDGFHLWSDSFDRELQDIFAVQDEVAAVIAKNLHLKLDTAPRAKATVNPEAYRLLFEGRHAALKGSEDNLLRAEALFSAALALEPEFAPAFSGRAYVWHMRARLRMVAPQFVAEELAHAEANARLALQADESLGDPYLMLGSVALLRGQFGEAQASLARGLVLSPNSDAGRNINGFLYLNLGRPDLALVEMEAARALSPLEGGLIDTWGLALASCRNYADAVDAFERAAVLWAAPVIRANHALALVNLGRHHAAIEQARAALDPAGQRGWQDGFVSLAEGLAAWALAKAGARDEAEAVACRILAGPAERHYNAGFAFALLGRWEDALALWRALPPFVTFYLLAFISENLAIREDPRVRDLLIHLGALGAYETREKVLWERATKP